MSNCHVCGLSVFNHSRPKVSNGFKPMIHNRSFINYHINLILCFLQQNIYYRPRTTYDGRLYFQFVSPRGEGCTPANQDRGYLFPGQDKEATLPQHTSAGTGKLTPSTPFGQVTPREGRLLRFPTGGLSCLLLKLDSIVLSRLTFT